MAASSSVGAAGRRRVGAAERRDWVLFGALVGPNLLLFAAFTYWPLLYNAYLSLVRWDMLAPVKTWVGLDNYTFLVRSSEFRGVLANTIVFAVASVGLVCVFGLAMALALNQPLRGRDLARAVIYAPAMLSGAAIGLVWMYILDPCYGLLDTFIRFLGRRSPDWLLDTTWAMPAIVLVYVWKNVGYAVIIYIAGLQAIPQTLHEAARVDGAGLWARFRHVTLPGLSPITFFLVLTNVLASFQAFDVVKVMTDGGPVGATTTLAYYLYREGFVAFNSGRAGVAAVVLFIGMLTFTLMQMRLTQSRVHYA